MENGTAEYLQRITIDGLKRNGIRPVFVLAQRPGMGERKFHVRGDAVERARKRHVGYIIDRIESRNNRLRLLHALLGGLVFFTLPHACM